METYRYNDKNDFYEINVFNIFLVKLFRLKK
jgi:hypothetical protein